MDEKRRVGFIGAGNMGGAIIKGLLDKGIRKASELIVADPRRETREILSADYPGLDVTEDNASAAKADILILAIKPDMYPGVLSLLSDTMNPRTVIVSIAVGMTINRIRTLFDTLINPSHSPREENVLRVYHSDEGTKSRRKKFHGGNAKIIRCMPNTPALVSCGMTALCPGEGIQEEELCSVKELFDSLGKTVVIKESMMDAYSALAASSPAWVFLFIEALADGAVREGIPRSMAYQVASQAVMGSAKMVQETALHPGILKDQVCSPGGTTIEAVASLEASGFRSALIEAVTDCCRRATEIGKE